jgi:hypothetical protein
VAAPDSTHRFAEAGEDRRYDEAEAGVVEGHGGVERTGKPLERRLACVAEPGLLIEVVNRDKSRSAPPVAYDPVVAAEPDWRVVRSLELESPALS